MNRNSILLSLFVLLSMIAKAQSSWQKISPFSDNIARISGEKDDRPYKDKDYNYGSEGVPSPRMNAVTWADPQGFLWVFGGIGYDESYNWGIFRDVWKYDPSQNQWKLMAGERNQVEKANRELADFPMARKEASAWLDGKGNLWLYGGRNLWDMQHLDDMWRFNVKQNIWEKVSGTGRFNQKPVHGSKNQTAFTNSPGGRSLSSCWTDKKGDLWLFGGIGYETTSGNKANYFNDLWKFDSNKQQWSWISGSEKANQGASFGKRGTELASIGPSPRYGAVTWIDEKSGQVFLYGGYGYDSTAVALGGLSDFWSYSIKSGNWTWIGNTKKLNADPEIFTLMSKENNPGYRFGAVSWMSEEGELYLTGGHNFWGIKEIDLDRRVWKYTTETGIWQPLPVTQNTNSLGAGAAFKDEKGALYVFGGEELDPTLLQARPTNNVWKFIP